MCLRRRNDSLSISHGYTWFSADLFFKVTAYPEPGGDQDGRFIVQLLKLCICEALKSSYCNLLKDEKGEQIILYKCFISFFNVTEIMKLPHG